MGETAVTTPELIAARWRKSVAARLIRLAGMVATGQGFVGSPNDTEIAEAYGVVVCLVGHEGVVVDGLNIRTHVDIQRVRHAIHDAFYPDEAERTRQYLAAEQAKVDAYMARPFPCEMGGSCKDRFETARGRATHYAAARRRVRDYYHQPGYELLPPPRPALGLVASDAGPADAG